ncbi:26S proteasome regulatory complex, non-ATPase subcomplex, Rpn1 subunit [Terfezia boudieri ATCC MYA-4762]|uniref:26S proteasome regulatory subunit RPN1 n=1 Tax=Terfezia boudieri ATCC MYA-4762 TaxID=1051890 RepID=A0A3N4MB23_9PEZI|nr:26S proteasome regulatory complex, non-ATPase subcomplex, Rpn1 subunit [Terfezia boudieri ATCC MYA-4762]
MRKGKRMINLRKELSEEDQQLKSELEMLVERLKENNAELYKPALEAIKNFIRTATSSMTAVPKPLKFLRPHYPSLTELYENWAAREEKFALADVLSVLGMTYADEGRTESLKYRLLAPSPDLGGWGHEYVRHLALEIGTEYEKRSEKDEDVKASKDLKDLALSLIPFFLSHNAEADAVDLLAELEMIEEIPPFLDENTYQRVCLYMVSMVNLLAPPEDVAFLRTAHTIYRQHNKLTQAMTIAIRLHDLDLIEEDFEAAGEDRSMKKQLSFLVARQHICLKSDDGEILECLSNSHLSDHYLALGKELNILEPKTPDDIYKSYLENARTGPGSGNMDSARHNLASTFVNAFVNAGFCKDTYMLVEDEAKSWVYKNKDQGMISAAASIGMLMQWNVEAGLQAIDRYMYADDPQIKAGAAFGIGLLNSGVRSDADPAMALLCEPMYLENDNPNIRKCAIMGLGLAYVGSGRADVMDLLLPIVSDTSLTMELSAMAALSLGLCFVGSSNGDISLAILQVFMERVENNEEAQLKDKWSRFLALGLALLFVGRQEEADTTLETLKAIDHPIAKHTSVLVDACAYAGTGNVLKFQSMLHLCHDHLEVEEGKEGADLYQTYAVLGLALIAMGEDIGSEMALRQFGHLMHYGEPVIRKSVPLAMGLLSASNPQMKVYDTLSRYSHDNDIDVAMNAILAMGLVGAGTNNARLAQLLRQLASYYHRDMNSVFMVRIAQGLLHMGKGTLSVNPFHSDRQVLSKVAVAGLLTVLISSIDAKSFILENSHYLLYFLAPAMHPRFLMTLDENLKPLPVNVRVGQAVDVVGQAGRPKTITGWQTQSTPVLLSYGERAELESDEYISLMNNLEGIAILKKNPNFQRD